MVSRVCGLWCIGRCVGWLVFGGMMVMGVVLMFKCWMLLVVVGLVMMMLCIWCSVVVLVVC